MKRTMLVAGLGLAVIATIAVFVYPGFLRKGTTAPQIATDTSSTVGTQGYYTCPMHPSVISDRPGACPVCGMALVRKTGPIEISKDELTTIESVTLSPTQRVLANVQTVPVRRRALSKEINAVGVVDVAEPLQATVSARFRGRIEKLHVDFTGKNVQRGQPLFELYSPDLVSAQQDYLLASQALKNATESQGQQNTEVQRRLLAAAGQRLQIHFGMTESQLENIEKKERIQSTLTFFSPITGTVISKQIQEGQYVDEGTVLYQLVDLSKVWVYLDVYEKDIQFIHLGQRTLMTTDAYPGEVFEGSVTFVDPLIQSETRTIRVRTEFENPKGKLKPNMFIKARISSQLKNSLVLPSSAILTTGKASVVWVEVKANTFEPRYVIVGWSTDDFTEILDGVHEGELVAAAGGFLIDSESALRQPDLLDAHKGHAKPMKTMEREQHKH
jgi:Cu(I)/Ag(I) efflux system membrane fusion protein